MRRSARAATAVVITSALGLVVAGTSTPGGPPTVLAAGGHLLLADHDDGSGDGSGSSGSQSGSGSPALDLGGALSGSTSGSSESGSSKSGASKSSGSGSSTAAGSKSGSGVLPKVLDGVSGSPSKVSSGSSSSASHDSGSGAAQAPAVSVPAVKLPAVQTPQVQLPEVKTPAVNLPSVQTPQVQLPSAQTPAVQLPGASVPSVSVPSVSVPSVSVPPVSVPSVSVPSVSVPPVSFPAVALPVVTPSTPLAATAPLIAPADVLAGLIDTPALPASLQLFGPPTGDQGVLRVAHLSPSTGAVDMYVSGPGLPLTRVASDVTYRTVSSYLTGSPGVYTLEARPAGAAPTTPAALTASVAVGPRTAQTAAFVDVGPNSTPQAEVLNDGTTAAPPGKGFVRVVSAADGVGPLDVIARGGGTLAQGLFYGSGSSYAEVDAKTWTMDVRTTNGESAVATVPVASTAVATVVVGRDAKGALAVTAVADAASAFPASPAPASPAPASPAPASSAPAQRPSPTPRSGKQPRGGVPAGFGGMAAQESRLVPVNVHAASPAPATSPAAIAAPSSALVSLTERLTRSTTSPLVALAARPATAPAAPAPAATTQAASSPLVPLSVRAPARAVRGPVALAPAAPIAAHPSGLVVPAAGIDARDVGSLGLDRTGALQAPATSHDVGWYGEGATPGDPGTAVMVGHVDSWQGPGVFYHLRDLKPGDTIDVPRSDGTVAHFAVDAIETVDKDAFPADKVYAPTVGPSLRLITCGGAFDRAARSYEDNVVVYASAR
ncbi:class F sortase [Actinomycetospora endophytica]|uniref:Class F sortase n=1 Tax=Actinomycetospora endophytica TaxID=2291215 RepID=A0ABS8PFU2_9PSEU|nr:class F sortase [Actinomycetospora endophytica]MCD2197044.1 class F sortase [Actinomycetospora endophytica]